MTLEEQIEKVLLKVIKDTEHCIRAEDSPKVSFIFLPPYVAELVAFVREREKAAYNKGVASAHFFEEQPK